MLPRWMRLSGAMIALLLGLAYWQRPDGLTHMYFLETPGDAFLMVTPSGKHLLIDGGTDPAALTSALGKLMPFWKRELDAVVLTRGDAGHATAQVAALARYHVREAFVARYGKADAVMREWQRLLAQGMTRIRTLNNGAQFEIDGVRVMDVADGAALRVSYGATSVLLAHNSAADTQMPAGVRSADLVAYPWQLDPRVEWLEALRPKAIVFTDGVRVDTPVLLAMDDRAVAHAALYHERLHGMIAWRSDGRRTAITIERSYCASISRMGWGALFASAQRPSASCSSRERS